MTIRLAMTMCLGVGTSIEYWGANLDTTFAWNINDTDFDATVGTGYNLFGLRW